MFQIDGRTIDYQETGPKSENAPAILFVPGSFSTPMAWRGLQKELRQNYRFISTSLCGYGATTETRTLTDCGIGHEVRVIEAVARKAGEPVHLVAHSFGGAVALATALAGNIDILSITTFEANPLGAVAGNPAHAGLIEDMKEMNAAFEAAVAAGAEDAAGHIIDYWGGNGSFQAMPEIVREYCRQTVGSNVLDWRGSFEFHATASDYAKISAPVFFVRGALANPLMVAITDALVNARTDSRAATVEGASHFLITTHPRECAELLEKFLSDIQAIG